MSDIILKNQKMKLFVPFNTCAFHLDMLDDQISTVYLKKIVSSSHVDIVYFKNNLNYTCRYVWYLIRHISFSVLRFGKSLDFILSALKTIHLSDPVLKLTITMSKLAQSVFLIFDHIIFAHNLGIIKADKEKWSRYSSQCWLFSLTLNLLRNSYDILSIISNEAKAQENRQRRGQYVNGGIEHSVTSRKPMGRVQILKKCCYENQPVVLDFVKNMSDLVLPLNSLGKIKVSGGIQGSLGLLSSAIGIATVWSPILKLVP